MSLIFLSAASSVVTIPRASSVRIHALGFAAAEVTCHGETCVGVDFDAAVFTCLHAPVAALAFLFADHYNARGFLLAERFFRDVSTHLAFAGSACQSKVEKRFHAYNADSAA